MNGGLQLLGHTSAVLDVYCCAPLQVFASKVLELDGTPYVGPGAFINKCASVYADVQ
jgi:hypothetical protein